VVGDVATGEEPDARAGGGEGEMTACLVPRALEILPQVRIIFC
jgi:hypothetical protein